MSTALCLALFGACLVVLGVHGAENPGGGPIPIRARSATGGPVKPATTRDYVIVTLIFAVAIAAIFVGLWFMKH